MHPETPDVRTGVIVLTDAIRDIFYGKDPSALHAALTDYYSIKDHRKTLAVALEKVGDTRSVDDVIKTQKDSLVHWASYLADARARGEFGKDASHFMTHLLLGVMHFSSHKTPHTPPQPRDAEEIIFQQTQSIKHLFAQRTPDTINPFPTLNPAVITQLHSLVSDPSVQKWTQRPTKKDDSTEYRYAPIVLRPLLDAMRFELHQGADTLKQALIQSNYGYLYTLLSALHDSRAREYLTINEKGKWVTATLYGDAESYSAAELAAEIRARGGNGDWCIEDDSVLSGYLKNNGVLHLLVDTATERLPSGKPRLHAMHVGLLANNRKVTQLRGNDAHQELNNPAFANEAYMYLTYLKGERDYSVDDSYLTRLRSLSAIGTIESKLTHHTPLSDNECRILYKDNRGMGYEKSELHKMMERRMQQFPDEARLEVARAFNIDSDEVALSNNDVTDKTRVFFGDYTYESTHGNIYDRMIYISGNVNFEFCASITAIPEGFSCGGNASFRGCSALTTIPEGFSCGGSANFHNCSSLTTIGNNFSSGNSVDFRGCNVLATIPQGFSCGGRAYFNHCTSLTTVAGDFFCGERAYFYESHSLKTIGPNFHCNNIALFDKCTSLTTIGPYFFCGWSASFSGCSSLFHVDPSVLLSREVIFPRHLREQYSQHKNVEFK